MRRKGFPRRRLSLQKGGIIMGLFSKLLGGGAEKAAKDLFNEFWKEAGGQPVPEDGPSQPQQSAPAQQAAPAQPAPAGVCRRSGCSPGKA